MSGKNYILSILFIYSFLGNSQEAVLCSEQIDYVKIENFENIPTVAENTDGTVTLIHQNQNITDIFAAHTIYDFYQAYPNSTGVLSEYYNIVHGNRTLIIELKNTVSPDVFFFDYDYSFTAISSGLIQELNGKTFNVDKFISTSDGVNPCYNPSNCQLDEVPNDFNFRINVNYNAETEYLTIESESLTSCGNAFSINLIGGNPNEFGSIENTLQLWESTSGTSDLSEFSAPCHYIESTIFALFGIACPSYDYCYGNISVVFNSEDETIRLIRDNQVFGYHIIELSEANLSTEEHSFKFMKIFEIEGNPYLQISNLNSQSIKVTIYNTSGQEIIESKKFKENSINISNLSTGLYFIKVSNLNNQQKIFKFLKNC